MAAPVIQGICDSEEMLVDLVEKAKNAGVTRMMWDKFNPKPIATSRLRRSLARMGELPPQEAGRKGSETRLILERECRRHRISLVDAF